jgi:L-iditol 2-dehydrogenase
MKVVRLHGVGDLRVHEEPIPEIKSGEALIRVTSVGVCGSDLHWFSEATIGDAVIERPLVLGHEFAGVIEEISGERSVLKLGQRVAVDPAIPCNTCEYCLEGNPNLCEHLHFAGHGLDDGAMREYLAWPTTCLYPLPESINDPDGAMLEPLGVAIHAVDLGQIRPGMMVGVFGCGPIGLLVLQVARAAGATRLIATDKLSHRLEAAQKMGATDVFLSSGGKENAEVLVAANNRGVDVAFEAAGENDAVETAIETVKPGGRVVLIGIPSDDHKSFRASTARRKGVTIKLCRRMKFTYPRAIKLVESGVVDVRSLVTHHFSLDESQEAFLVANRRDGIKAVLEML